MLQYNATTKLTSPTVNKTISALSVSAVHRTLEAQVAHVQDGRQQLGDLPVLGLGEHEDLHGRQDARVIAQVVSTVTRCAVTLKHTKPVGLS